MNKKGRPPLPASQKRIKAAITLSPEHHTQTAGNRSKIITEALNLYFEDEAARWDAYQHDQFDKNEPCQ